METKIIVLPSWLIREINRLLKSNPEVTGATVPSLL